MYACKYNNICLGSFCFLRKPKTISDEVSHILNVGFLIIMREQYGVLFLLKLFNLSKKIQ